MNLERVQFAEGYEVDSDGRVFSLNHNNKKGVCREMKQLLVPNGYLQISTSIFYTKRKTRTRRMQESCGHVQCFIGSDWKDKKWSEMGKIQNKGKRMRDDIAETLKKVEIMQAWCEGKAIDHSDRMDSGYVSWFTFPKEIVPAWNWDANDYRIKPTPKTRPFTLSDLKANVFVKAIVSITVWRIDGFDDNGLYISGEHRNWEHLKEHWQWSDSIHGPWLPFTVEEKE